MNLARHIGIWSLIDSGRKPGLDQMAIDAEALEMMSKGTLQTPLVRFFEWSEPVVTYGYLLDPSLVQRWAEENGGASTVKRPTGGGAVQHTSEDLSVSFLWPRRLNILSENPRICYGQIHEALQKGLASVLASLPAAAGGAKQSDFQKKECSNIFLHDGLLQSHKPLPRNDNIPKLPVCFQEPVCNDVMMGEKKVIGGALRVTKQAILYQGTIQCSSLENKETLKIYLAKHLRPLLIGTEPVYRAPTTVAKLSVLA